MISVDDLHVVLNPIYSRLPLSRSPRDALKYFEISVLRHIRFAELGEKLIRLTTFNKYMRNWTLEVRDILKYCGKEEKFFSTIFFYLLLDFHVSAGTRFSLRDKRLFEISEFEIARVNCFGKNKNNSSFVVCSFFFSSADCYKN